MKRLQNVGIWLLGAAVLSLLASCGPIRNEPDSWSLPKKESAESGMIVGRIDLPNNKKENPEDKFLNLKVVEFRNTAKNVHFGNAGEDHYIMSNNYFVVPNLKPGTYQLFSFRAGDEYHSLFGVEGYTFEVKPGQIKFIGSFDYLAEEPGTLKKIAMALNANPTLHFALRPSRSPSELEALQWLNRVGVGSGWEPSIMKRIKELGGQVVRKEEQAPKAITRAKPH